MKKIILLLFLFDCNSYIPYQQAQTCEIVITKPFQAQNSCVFHFQPGQPERKYWTFDEWSGYFAIDFPEPKLYVYANWPQSLELQYKNEGCRDWGGNWNLTARVGDEYGNRFYYGFTRAICETIEPLKRIEDLELHFIIRGKL